MKKLICILLPLLCMGTALAEEAAATAAKADIGALMSRGLIVTAGGLCGVFLVLILFYATIKMMQKILK